MPAARRDRPTRGGDGRRSLAPDPVDQVEHRRQVLAGSTGVDPVGAAVVAGEQGALGDHARKRLPLDRDLPALRDAGEDRRLEHVGPGVDEVGGRLAGRRLLDERLDPAVGIRRHDAERRGVVDLVEGDRALASGGVVEGDERADVEFGHDVAVDDDEALLDAGLMGGEPDGAGGVEGLGFDRVTQAHAGALAVGIGGVEGVGAVAEGQHGLVDAVTGQSGEDPLDHRPVDDGQHLLRGGEGQGPQAGTEASDEHHGAHGVTD